MYEQVRALIEREKLLEPGQVILVGVSGGPDSLVLMDVLDCLGYPLIVAHLNHSLRQEADEEAREVQRIAESRELIFTSEKRDVAGYAQENALSIEEAARIVRYEFLFRQAAKLNAQAVAVGHTANDQVETVVMHLLRGCGLAGLKGMQFCALPNSWSREIALLRPLLALWREDIISHCVRHHLKPVFDSSNLDNTYFRNLLRNELIPYLEKYNPAIKEIVWRMANVLEGDHRVLVQIIEKEWQTCVLSHGRGYVIFDHSALKGQPIGLQRGLLRQGINQLRPGLRDIDFNSVERAVNFILKPTQTGQIDLIAGLRLWLEDEQLILAGWDSHLPTINWPQIINGGLRILPISGQIDLGNDWVLRCEPITDLTAAYRQALMNDDPFQAWVSTDDLQGTLLIRSRKPGDRIQPLGMGGHSVKLSEYMINVKIPRRVRDAWPVIATQTEIVWVPGIALTHPYRLTETTHQALYLHLSRIGDLPLSPFSS
jgi:tRNA(Ile)-lysidine synthase